MSDVTSLGRGCARANGQQCAVQSRPENIGITDTYLQGLGVDESLERVWQQAMPTVPASALLELTRGGA